MPLRHSGGFLLVFLEEDKINLKGEQVVFYPLNSLGVICFPIYILDNKE